MGSAATGVPGPLVRGDDSRGVPELDAVRRAEVTDDDVLLRLSVEVDGSRRTNGTLCASELRSRLNSSSLRVSLTPRAGDAGELVTECVLVEVCVTPELTESPRRDMPICILPVAPLGAVRGDARKAVKPEPALVVPSACDPLVPEVCEARVIGECGTAPLGGGGGA